MNIKYHKWLEVHINHNYFPNNETTGFNMVPLYDTARILKNNNLLIHQERNKFNLFAGVEENSEFDRATTLNDLGNLYIQLISQDSLFFNYTDVPSLDEDTVFFFSNAGSPDEVKRLQKEAYVSDLDLLKIRPPQFVVPVPENTSNLEISNAEGEILQELSIESSTEDSMIIDLRQWPEGVYQISHDDTNWETFLLTHKRLEPACIGILEINLDTVTNRDSSLVQYTLGFNSRSVHRQYKIVVAESRNIQVLEIGIKGSAGETYSGPESETIIGEQEAMVFTSNTLLPLRQKIENHPVLELKYKSEQTGNPSEMDIKLPNPSAENLKKFIDGEMQDAYFSPTIIYV